MFNMQRAEDYLAAGYSNLNTMAITATKAAYHNGEERLLSCTTEIPLLAAERFGKGSVKEE